MRKTFVLLAGLGLLLGLHALETGFAGHVTVAGTGAPIYHASIGGSGGSGYTDSTGYYFIAASPGWYKVYSTAVGFTSGMHPESVHVVQGQVTGDVNIGLVSFTGKTGICGRLTNAAVYLPVGGGTVVAQGPNGRGTAVSVAWGGYVIPELPPGRYQVKAEAAGFETATFPESVSVYSGQMRENVNIYLTPTGGLPSGFSGRITDWKTGEPLRGASVTTNGRTAYSDSTGRYTLTIEPGSYSVWSSATGYLNGIYPESVRVSEHRMTTGIDFALVPLAGVTGVGGRLTDADRMLGIPGGTVTASGPNGHGTATSVRTGGYLIAELPPGKYQVTAEAQGFVTMVTPESVVVKQDSVRWCPFYMHRATNSGGIAGRVTSTQNGQVIAGAEVRAWGPGGHGGVLQGTYGYVISQLAAGEYWVSASAAGYEPGNFPESVLVTVGHTTERIDFQLRPTGEIGRLAGTVVNAEDSTIILRALVKVTNGRQSYQVLQDQYGYRFYIPPGKYWVSAAAEGFEPGCYPESVTVIANQNTQGIDFALRPRTGGNGAISGTVTNARGGEPIRGALVVATGPGQGYTNTGERGTYLIRELEPGTYLVMACARGFQPSPWDTVEVTAGHTTPDINFALEPLGGEPGGIAGDVVDSATSSPIHYARVFASGPSGQGRAYSDAQGNYLITGLRAGWYRVSAEAQGYYPAVYPESVEVLAGQTTYRINFLLRPVETSDAGVAGTAYNGYTQTELAGACVRLTGYNGCQDAYTDEHGNYLVSNLDPGDYVVEFSAPGYFADEHPVPVTIAAGEITLATDAPLYPLSAIVEKPERIARQVSSLRVAPNPCAGRALLRWQTATEGRFTLRVFDNSGRSVRTLASGNAPAGTRSANWDGRDDAGRRVSNGIYFFRLQTPDTDDVVKVTVVAQ